MAARIGQVTNTETCPRNSQFIRYRAENYFYPIAMVWIENQERVSPPSRMNFFRVRQRKLTTFEYPLRTHWHASSQSSLLLHTARNRSHSTEILIYLIVHRQAFRCWAIDILWRVHFQGRATRAQQGP